MNCPVCNVALTMADRQGVEIDYCPKCRGVWLDRGELDKIIERAATESTTIREPEYQRETYPVRSDHDDRHHQGHHPHKRKSFFGEIFDFD
ncbi:MAG TPA: zf-TFIIB domain-containing protein [Blastocatellia bacterium]|nr:zf-TFIIB domain-containing protein [Blastocatellia bacterium]